MMEAESVIVICDAAESIVYILFWMMLVWSVCKYVIGAFIVGEAMRMKR